MKGPGWEAGFIEYARFREGSEHSVSGTVVVLPGLRSRELGNERPVAVYLPPSYASTDRRYPVLYMQDGQNLFDRFTSYAGEWHADETLESLAAEGIEAIAVGIWNAGRRRLDEYSPFATARSAGRGDAYLAFVVETVKPLIDSAFRTLPARDRTGVLGSSLGGLISLYALRRHPEVFGMVGAMSPSLGFAGAAILRELDEGPLPPSRLWVDGGHRELPAPRGVPLRGSPAWPYIARLRRLRGVLRQRASSSRIAYHEDRRGLHNEAAWARRLPDALRFLLDQLPGDHSRQPPVSGK